MTPKATLARPPLSNRGANWPTGTLHADWYQATIPVLSNLNDLFSALSVASNRGANWSPTAALYGYSLGWRLDGVPVGSVQVFMRGSEVHVQATSAAAVPVRDVLRRRWPSHRCSRLDVAFDEDAPGVFDARYGLVHRLARDGSSSGGRKITTSTAGDWLDKEAGRTFYAGGASSRLRVVVYEKGHEQRAKDPNCGASLDWSRTEFRIRPDTPEGKVWLAQASLADALGFTPFGAVVASVLLGEAVPVADSVRRYASQDPGYWMARSYGAVVDELLGLDPFDAVAQLAAWRSAALGLPVPAGSG